MRYFATLLAFMWTFSAFSQATTTPLTKKIIVKTNLMSLLANRPTITLEKVFSKTLSCEVGFVQGHVNDFLLTDHYDYNGFLIRAKKYFEDVDYGTINSYAALYIGNLKRTIQTAGHVDNTGFFSWPSRDFSANSIRAGGSVGGSYISKSRFVIDGLVSLGYGKYISYYKLNSIRDSNGYLDAQIWISIGYCF
jgi:hypothetical protein